MADATFLQRFIHEELAKERRAKSTTSPGMTPWAALSDALFRGR